MPTAKGLFLLPFLLLWSARALAQDPADRRTPPFDRPGDYVTVDTCAECHAEEADRILGGIHQPVPTAKTLKGCETCHGPGKAHADTQDAAKITHPGHLPRAEQEALCARCHRDQMQRHGGDPRGFVLAGKTCTDCHDIHRLKKDEPGVLEPRRFGTRTELSAATKAVGGAVCQQCHPRKAQQIRFAGHKPLAPETDPKGCESCHGHGALHQSGVGIPRLITRPDRAGDGIATCRTCHERVDATEFHWRGGHSPLLTPGLTCTACHTIHDRKAPEPEPPGSKPAPKKISQADLRYFLVPLPDAPAAPHAQTQPAPAAAAAEFVGNAACRKCHAPAFTDRHAPAHAALKGDDRAPGQGCESCHGPGSAHAEGPGRKSLIRALKDAPFLLQKSTCLQCHGGERPLTQVCGGSHAAHGVGCVACHAPATAALGAAATRRTAEQSCGRCHAAVLAEFRLPNHHRVPEGQIACSDCHDAHGARPRLLDLKLKKDTCTGCHREYAGPFVFEHQASRSDGCVACHTPHGATNRRLLKQHNTQQNCIACHADFPAFHDQSTGAVFTNCLRCHTELHGSNVSRFFFR